MRKTGALGLAIVIAVFGGGCASSGPKVDIIEPEIRMAQMRGTSFMMRYQGRLTIRYAVEVTNLSGESIDLERIELRVIGDAPYDLQRDAIPAELTIPPGEMRAFQLSVLAFSKGVDPEPSDHVAIRGIAHFDSALGKFRTSFRQVLRQPDDTAPR